MDSVQEDESNDTIMSIVGPLLKDLANQLKYRYDEVITKFHPKMTSIC